MLEYTFRQKKEKNHLIFIEFKIDQINENLLNVQLPAWRPGRYALGDFAKNICEWKVEDENGNTRSSKKKTKDLWEIDSESTQSITISYSFYANLITAGDSFANESFFYINPINCALYIPNRKDESAIVKIDTSQDLNIVTAIKKNKEGQYQVESFDELVDSPIICSEKVQSDSFIQNDIKYHIHFCGEAKPDFDKVENDFRKFISTQIHAFDETFPVKEYHFIYIIMPYRTYHGVEHHNSTVIALGPSYDMMDNQTGIYDTFLGISSHEHYHTWNIKQIRPDEMHPYKYEKENYSRLGYLAEGATTLLGDLFLIRSDVFSFKQWATTFNKLLNRHFSNYGRFNLSVADSSFDTWLDGYELGAPNRKVSIYTEGALCTFMLDYLIKKATSNKASFDDVMHSFYFDFAKKGKGITEEDYQNTAEKVAGKKFNDFFNKYVNGTTDYEPLLKESLQYYGLELIAQPAENKSEGFWGIQTKSNEQNQTQLFKIAADTPAQKAGLVVGDLILSINGLNINDDLDKWAAYFIEDKEAILTVQKKDGTIKNTAILWEEDQFFKQYHIEINKQASDDKKNNYKKLIWDN